MSEFTFPFGRSFRLRRLWPFIGVIGALSMFGSSAGAHPLGNFTTNTATVIQVNGTGADVTYFVDLAEIPALKARQEMGKPKGPVPVPVAEQWRDKQCREISENLRLTHQGKTTLLTEQAGSKIAFPAGQAGLTTLRLECHFTSAWSPLPTASIAMDDANFSNRIGWREITALGNGVQISGDVSALSPTDLLRSYSTAAVASPLRQLEVTFKVSPASSSSSNGAGSVASVAAIASEASGSLASGTSSINRGNDGLTERFQSLLDHRSLTFAFVVGALLLAVLLGGLHALAPGHGKTIIAAYALGRRGRTADIVAIGGTVAATHTVGIMLLGALVSATTVVSPDRSLRWASVLSGVLVIGVGFTLLRTRLQTFRKHTVNHHDLHGNHEHEHEHPHHDHEHPHQSAQLHPHHPPEHDLHHAHERDRHQHSQLLEHPREHAHPHPHDHAHPHPHDQDPQRAGGTANTEPGSLTQPHPEDARFIVTSHSHGGWSHDHVLPAPGAVVRRRELVMMGLAGGLVPSPSALVVLLGAIAVGRVAFGVALVVAYGIGLAATLVGAGLLMVRFERGMRSWSTRLSTTSGARLQIVSNALPLVSGFAIAGAGILLLARSISQL